MPASPMTRELEADAVATLARGAAPIRTVLVSLGLPPDWIEREVSQIARDRTRPRHFLGAWSRTRLQRWERLEAAQARGILASLAQGRVSAVRLALAESPRPAAARSAPEEPAEARPPEDRAESLRRRGFV